MTLPSFVSYRQDRLFIQSCEQGSREHKIRVFFTTHVLIEVTLLATVKFLGECALHRSTAESSGHYPAGPAGVHSAVHIIEPFFHGSGTFSQIMDVRSSGLTPAFLELPTIQFGFSLHFDIPLSC
jgi:hypothetical protein